MKFKILLLQLFAHEHQERWSKLVLAKLRNTVKGLQKKASMPNMVILQS